MENKIGSEDGYKIAFELISVAGTAKSLAMESVDCYREFDFVKGDQLLEQSESTYLDSHGIQTNMLAKEAEGEKTPVNVFLIHAQDHLTMANTAIENAKEFKHIYRLIYALTKTRKEVEK